MTGATERPEANQSGPPGIVRVDRPVRRRVECVGAVMRQMYAATSWDNRIAEIERAVWGAVEAEQERCIAAVEALHMAQATNNQNHPSAWHNGVDAAIDAIRDA
jgi:hypothetical protein